MFLQIHTIDSFINNEWFGFTIAFKKSGTNVWLFKINAQYSNIRRKMFGQSGLFLCFLQGQ